MYLYQKGYDRTAQMQRALPDALDLLVISVEAGLAFDSALSQVARNTEGPLANEFAVCSRRCRSVSAASNAMRALGERTHASGPCARFATAMVQADAFGIPIGHVLRVQSDEMRVKRRQRAEEQAQKVPVEDPPPADGLHPAVPVHRRHRPSCDRPHGVFRKYVR